MGQPQKSGEGDSIHMGMSVDEHMPSGQIVLCKWRANSKPDEDSVFASQLGI